MVRRLTPQVRRQSDRRNDLMDLLSTVAVHNASPEPGRLAVIIRFGRLFLGELWGSYARFIIPGLH
jgi:hypothetical protein